MQVLPSGGLPPNPTELLDSVAMAELVTEWRSRFDLIVIDTPPVLAVADAVVCSAIVDATLVIYRYGRTRRAQVAGALRALQGVDARVIGTVLNARPKRGGDAEYSAGYGEYIDPTRHVYEKMRSATQDQDVLRALREGLLSAPAGERRTGGRATDGGWRPGAEPHAEPSAAPPPKKTPPASARPGGGGTNPRESGRRSTHRSTRSGRQRD
jgi:hypothetical protein